MMRVAPWLLIGLAAGWPPNAFPAEKNPEAKSLAPLLTGGSTASLAGGLRGYLLQALPDPLHESNHNWGHQTRAAKGVKWTGHILPLRPEIVRGDKKQGDWYKIRITALNPANTLVVDLRDVRSPEPGRLQFTLFIALDARVDYHRQIWERGVKIWDHSIQARLRASVSLECEAATRLEANGSLVPDAVLRLEAKRADVHFDNVVVEHILGMGGDAAKTVGDTLKTSLHHLAPDFERDLLKRANAAAVKAAKTREVRLGLGQLFKKRMAPTEATKEKGGR